MVDLVQWWYSRGWSFFASSFKQKLKDSADFFSFSQLVGTLFKPFRQISANSSARGISGFMDRLVSRFVGFFSRIFILIFGGIAVLIEVILGTLILVVWPFFPLLIIAGIVLTVMGMTL